MKQNFFNIFLILIIVLFSFCDYLFLRMSNYYNFYSIPILHDGRIKPFGILADNFYNQIHDSKNNNSIKWFANIFFNSESIKKDTTISIKNKETLFSLGLTNSNINLLDLISILNKNKDFFEKIKNEPFSKDKNKIELISLYNKAILFVNLINYFDLFRTMPKSENYTSKYDLIINGSYNYENFVNVENHFFKMIPQNNTIWFSFEEFFIKENFIRSYELDLLKKIYLSYKNNDLKTWSKLCKDFLEFNQSKLSVKNYFFVKIEILYKNLFLIKKSAYCFLFCFFSFLFFYKNNLLRSISKTIFCLSSILIFFDISLRIIITQKAPITNLYESTIFVYLIFSLIFSFLLFKYDKEKLLTFSSLFLVILSFFTLSLNLDDNITPVMAVLNTNFWLTIHVITIAIGYSFCLITGFLGHIYLPLFLKNEDFYLKKITSLINSFSFLALFFSFIGTLLGGVWADYSWGRFWGWDPKENGALLIVLWLTLFIHAKISNMISDFLFSVGMVLNINILLISWFGVNLLNIGLHSYGFTENIERSLCTLFILEFLYVFYFLINYKNKSDIIN